MSYLVTGPTPSSIVGAGAKKDGNSTTSGPNGGSEMGERVGAGEGTADPEGPADTEGAP